MQHVFSVVLLCITFCCQAQTPSGISWYKQWSGTIAQYPVTLHLHKAGHTYTGYYYYQSQQNPVYFIGEDTSLNGMISLKLFADREEEEVLMFSITGSTAKGEWRKRAGSKPLPFTANVVSEAYEFQYVFTRGSTLLQPKMKDSPAATFEAAAIWPKGNSPTEAFLKKVIREAFATTAEEGEIGGFLLKNKKAFLADYLAEHKAVTLAALEENAVAYNADETSHMHIAYHSPTILTLAHYNYRYTGGAHGNYGTTYRSYNTATGSAIELKHVLTPAGIKALPALLSQYFKSTYKLKKEAALTEVGLYINKLEPNENYYVTGKGIGFSYFPYEIGPYALGEVKLFIPFTVLQNYLQPTFLKNLQ